MAKLPHVTFRTYIHTIVSKTLGRRSHVDVEVIRLDINVTEIKVATIDHPRLFADELPGSLLGIHGVKVHLPVEDMVADADVNESVLHGELVSWTPETGVRT